MMTLRRQFNSLSVPIRLYTLRADNETQANVALPGEVDD